MKKSLFVISVSILLWLSVWFCESWLSFNSKLIDGKLTKIISVELNWQYYVIPSVSETAKPLKWLMSQVWWIAGINWAYFCPNDYEECWWVSHTYSYRKFLGYEDNDINGQNNKAIFGISYSWVPLMKTKTINTDADIAFWISNFPAILIWWNDVLDFEGLAQKNIEKWTKAFICSDKSGTVIKMGFVYNITLSQMPKYIKTYFKCRNALNLDWGGSLAMSYGTGYLRQGRSIMDAFVVVTSWVWNRLMSWNNYWTSWIYTWYIASPYSGISWEEYKYQQTIKSYRQHYYSGDYVKIFRWWIVSQPNVVCRTWDVKCVKSKEVHLKLFEVLTTKTH